MTERWVISGSAGQGEAVLFLPGWGFSGRVLELAGAGSGWITPHLPLDPASCVDELSGLIAGLGIGPVHLVGWSMGGNLAINFAASFPEQVARLTLLGMRASWPAPEIDAIRSALCADPPAFMQDFFRKCLLGHRMEHQRFVREQQESLLAGLDMELLGRGLDYLAHWRLPDTIPHCPVACWHGRRDVIAPVSERLLLPGAADCVLEHAGHAVFLDRECIISD